MRESLDEIGLKHGTDKASKGHDYLRHYEKHLAPLRDQAFLLIEIGGLRGSSLRMWQEYLPNAQIVCIDINPAVKDHEAERIAVEIGNSASRDFLEKVVAKHGIPTVVIDDGSHRWDHQRVAFETLFPRVRPGGFFIVEDLHTSYEPRFSGDDEQPFVQYLYKRADYLHLRATKRTDYIGFYSKRSVALAQMIESVTFVPRSSILYKRMPKAKPEVPAAEGSADDAE